jgi:serine/threonine protein kinase
MRLTNVGTPLFVDPNVKTGDYSFKCDVYSAGLVIAHIFCGKHFFSDCKNEDELNESKKAFTKDIVVSTTHFL